MSNNRKVFGIGLSKTGTTSLYVALAQLGYRSITYRHMALLGLEEWMCGDFSADYFAEIDAVTDLPMAALFREMDARYPGSKFILTVRAVEPWIRSASAHFSPNRNGAKLRDGGVFSSDVRLMTYGVRNFSEERFRRIHAEHHRAVVEYFADRPDDLLVIDITAGQGWSELCSFLSKHVPPEPFPNVKPGYEAYPDAATHFSAYPIESEKRISVARVLRRLLR